MLFEGPAQHSAMKDKAAPAAVRTGRGTVKNKGFGGTAPSKTVKNLRPDLATVKNRENPKAVNNGEKSQYSAIVKNREKPQKQPIFEEPPPQVSSALPDGLVNSSFGAWCAFLAL